MTEMGGNPGGGKDTPGKLTGKVVNPANKDKKDTGSKDAESRFAPFTPQADPDLDGLMQPLFKKWAAQSTRFFVVASRFDPWRIAKAFAPHSCSSVSAALMASNAELFENADDEKLLAVYREARPRGGGTTLIIDAALEGYLGAGAKHLLRKGGARFSEQLRELDLVVIVSLQLNEARPVTVMRPMEWVCVAPWHDRWFNQLAELASISESNFDSLKQRMDQLSQDTSEAGDERDAEIFNRFARHEDNAANVTASSLLDSLQKDLDRACRGEIDPAKDRATLAQLLRGDQNDAPDEVVRAMILITAFTKGPGLAQFRELCEAVLCPGPVDHLNQLPPGMRERETTRQEEARARGESFTPPSWLAVSRECFDQEWERARLRLADGRVSFKSDWNSSMPREEILQNHANLVTQALERIAGNRVLHDPNLPRAKLIMELLAQSHAILDERKLAHALANVPKPKDDSVEAVLEMLNEAAWRIGELLGVYLVLTKASSEEDHPFWRLIEQLRHIWRKDIYGGQVLEAALLLVLAKANSKTAVSLAEAIGDFFELADNEVSRYAIVELTASIANEVSAGSGELRPEMWLLGFAPSLPGPRAADHRSGFASVAVEQVLQFEIRWGSISYAQAPYRTLATVVLGPPKESSAVPLDPAARAALDGLFLSPTRDWIKSQLALAMETDIALEEKLGLSGQRFVMRIEYRLLDVAWMLLGGVSERAFKPLKSDEKELIEELFAVLAQHCRVEASEGLAGAARQIVLEVLRPSEEPSPSLEDDENPTSRGWLVVYALFRAALFAHWRFLTFDTEALVPESLAAQRLDAVLDYLAERTPRGLAELGRSLETLAVGSHHLAGVAEGYRASRAQQIYRDKSVALDKLAAAVSRRIQDPGVTNVE